MKWATRAAVGLAMAMLAASTSAEPPTDPFLFGVAWYPGEWPEQEWEADLAAMNKANINVVRIAEFSWGQMEPRQGVYDFAWLDRAILAARRHGLKVILGTPSAAPPIWLTEKYPEVLVRNENGQSARHGRRRHGSVGSLLYRRQAAAIAGAMAKRYGKDATVVAFQIDNEYGRESYDDGTRRLFQRWLADKYKTIDALNQTYFARYWSQTYARFDQLEIPRSDENPALYLDYMRFLSDAWRDFQQAQIDAMRPYLVHRQKITTNFYPPYFGGIDFSVPAQRLDVVGWDWYYEQPTLDPAEGALNNDFARGFLGRNTWVMEASAGNVVYAARNYTQPAGTVRQMVWQAVGHGADAYAFWVWRPPLNGWEVFHGAVVDAGGKPKPVYDEIARTGGELARAWPALRGTTPVVDTAMIQDYPSRWMLQRPSQSVTNDYDPWQISVRYRRALGPNVAGVDVLQRPANLSRYKLVVAPTLHLLSAEDAGALDRYVRAGGHLVLGPRSAAKQPSNALWRARQPGPLADLLGAEVDQTQVPEKTVGLDGRWGQATATVWAERLVATRPGLETLYTYRPYDGWLDGAPAVVTRQVGKGRVTYVGALLDEAALARVISWAAGQAGAAPVWRNVPKDVEVVARTRASCTSYVALNWSDKPQRLPLPRRMVDVLSGKDIAVAELAPKAVLVSTDRQCL